MARKRTGTPKKREMEVQGTQMTEAALKKRSQGIWIRRISAMMSALLACALFYVLMKPAITMENGNGSGNGAQLVCTVPEHVHTEQCWGFDHPETEPVYGLSRELECNFVPHVHDISCYDEAGELICGISERYIHVHDDLCYDQGNLVCLLEESPWNPEEEAVQERVLVCDLPETAGHVHTDACYTVTYLTDEEPVCGLKEGGHVHTEDCYGPVLICEEEHEHTDECYAEGLVCHLEEGTEHVHTLSCYPSIRELTCGLEETEGHVHDEDCYAFLTVEKEPHVHTEACYADDQLICGELEIRSHQHTEACWHETQVMLSGGHVHNRECVKVLLCGMQQHVHTRECYSGPETEIQLLLAEDADTEKNGEAAQEADADMQEMLLEEEQLLTEEMDAVVDGVHLEDGEVIRTDENESLQEEDGVLLSEEEELFSEWELVNEDPEWEDVQWEDEAMEEPSDDGQEMSASQEVSEETTEPEHAVTDDAAETPASEQITEDPTETENSVADDAAGSRFEEAHYLQEVETLEDGTFAVHLHEDEGIYFRTILEKAGVEAEPVDVTSDIPFLDIREDSFVCRFAFTEGSVVIRAGGEELTVKCTYAGPRTETENTAETGETESSAETAADGLDNRVNAEVETGEDSAEGTDTEPGEKEAAGNVHAEETAVDGQEDGTQTEGAAGEVPAGETDTEHLDGDSAGEDSAVQTAADGQEDGTRSEDASGDNPAEGTGADHAGSDAAGEDRAEDNAADGREHRTESEDGTEQTSAGEIDAESEGNEAAGENGTEDALTFVKELEKVVDGVYSVRLSLGSAVRLGDIPELEGIAPEEIIISSEIEDLETGTDYFACRKAFEQGKVILTSGDIRVTVQCTYVPVAEEYEAGSADAAVDGIENAENGENGNADADNGENAGEDADAADETGNADASGEEGQDAAEPEIQDAARVLLNGEETDLLRLEENPEDAEAVLDMLHTYLALEASESQEIGLEEDAAAAEAEAAEGDEETRLTYTHVFRMEAEETFEGVAAISMPVHARFSNLLPDGTYLTSVNCQLFHIDLDHGEILPVQNFEVEINDEEIVSLAFETERTGNWVLLCTLDYAFEERAAVLTLDFSDFDAMMLEDTEETGISVIEAEPEMNAEPAPGRRLLAKGRNNGQKKEENRYGFGGISIDLARLLEAVYAQNGAGEGEFQGIRMLMENLAGAEFSIETLVQEMSEGGVSCDGMSLQILDNGSIMLRGKHMTLTIRIQGFAREKQEIYAYTFGEQKTVSMSEIFRASGMPEQFVPARFAYEVSDDELVSLIRDGNDWLVTANSSFDEVKLFVRRGWYSGTILLHNPGNTVEPGTEIRSSDGAVSIVLNEEAVLPDGTELTVQPSEGMDIRPLLDQDFGENTDVQVKWFDISLGDVHEIQAVVTLHGVIDVPEFARKRGNVQARVYHAGSNGLEVLDAEIHGTDISFVTNGFSEFAVAYTVDFHWEMNGETYEISLPGGGAVSLTRLLSALGFQNLLATEDFGDTVQTDAGNTADGETENGKVLGIYDDGEDSGNASGEEAGYETDNGSDRSLLAFAEQIQSVSFSDPALVWTGKAELNTTVGQMKEDNALECNLSSDMTADMLEEANNMQITAGDWALISLMPFTSEESLTVTMKNGDVFVIRVTDAQIRKTVISASGEAYDITVTFDDDAGIPDTADLVVREIMEENPEYAAYYAAASDHVNTSDTESDADAADDAAQETNDSGNEHRVIAEARFFDIEIWNDGSKIEPLKPVSVEIRLVDSAELADAVPEVLHFAKSGLESIEYTDRSTDENGRVFAFETDGFSVYSVVYTVDFHYEIDGKTYKFQLPGGGFLSLEHLVEALGLAEIGDSADENASVETGDEAAGTSTEAGKAESQEAFETESSEASDVFLEATIRLNNMPVSDATKLFVANVANMEFSSPTLVWTGKVDAGTTVAQLKEENGLEIQYSADFSDEQIDEINAQMVEAGDWALISLLPFASEETLTISMENGDEFFVRVTDAQERYFSYNDLNGREYTLICVTGTSALLPVDMQTAENDNDRLKALQLSDSNTAVTPWKFEKVAGTSNTFYISNSGKYLNIKQTSAQMGRSDVGNVGDVMLSDIPQELWVTKVNDDGSVCIENTDHYKLDLWNQNASFGFGAYRTTGSPGNHQRFMLVKPDNNEILVTVTPTEGGTVSGKYADGNTKTEDLKSFYTSIKEGYGEGYINNAITAKSDAGYVFDHWQLNGKVVSSNISNKITGDAVEGQGLYVGNEGGHILTAVFRKTDIAITQNDITMGHVGYSNNSMSFNTSTEEETLVLANGKPDTTEYTTVTAQNTITAIPSDPAHYRFVRWDVSNSSNVISWGSGYSAESSQIKPTVTNDVTFTAVFEEIEDFSQPVDYSADAQALIDRLKRELESDPAVLNKTAHVVDEENRIYEVDLTSSSHRKVLAYSMTLAFITDVSRSMYFPANLEPVTGLTLKTDKNSATGGWDNAYGLISWLNNQSVVYTKTNEDGKTYNYRTYNGKNVYYMIGDVNGTATSLALFYNGTEWKVADASYFDDLYNNSRNSIVATHSRVNNSIDDHISFNGGYYRLRAGGSQNANGSEYPLNDGISAYQPNIYLAYETADANSTFYTRLDYLKKAVKIVTNVVYGVNESAKIGLVTFARGSARNLGSNTNDKYVHNLYTIDNSEDLYNAIDDISLYGGTRQDLGLNTTRNENWFSLTSASEHPQVAILVTDGAPNISGVSNTDAWNNYVRPEAEALQKQGVELFTLGLSLDKVGSNKDSLYSIAGTFDGTNRNNDDTYKFNAENGEEIIEKLLDIIRVLELNGHLLAKVTDTIDPAFYPLDASGNPIQEGVYSENGIYLGKINELLNNDGTPKPGTAIYSTDNTTKYCTWEEAEGSWQVTWYNQNINKEKANGDAGWTQSFQVKAREDFLGGNALNTNAGQATISAERFTVEEYSEIGEFTEPVTQAVSTPRVNVVELGLDGHNTEWDIYLGSEVDPVEELKALYEEIKVQERVTNSDEEHRIDGDKVEPGDGSEMYSLLDKIELEDEDWETLLNGQTVTLPYNDYGHNDVGTITVTLVKNESGDVAGEDTYSLKVMYTPDEPDADTDYKTTPGGSPGRLADSIESDNTHTIDEYYLPNSFKIEKTDGNDPITDSPALFKLYRATKEGDPGISVTLERYGLEGQYTAIETSHTYNGFANIGGLLDELGNAKDEALLMNASDGPYYLIESGAPMGYSRTRTPVKIEVIAGPNFYTDLDGNPIAVEEGEKPTGLYNMTQGVTIKINDSVAALYNTDGTPAILTDGAGNARNYLIEGDSGIYWQTIITNTPITANLNAEQGQILPYKKTIDYLGDAQDNPDTTADNNISSSEEKLNAVNDLYRLYLDAKLFNTVTNANIILVEDYSTSMNTENMDGKTRYNLVRDVLVGDRNNTGFIDTVLTEDSGNMMSVIKFSDPWTHVLKDGSTDKGSEVLVNWTDNAATVIDGIDHDYPDADTSITHTVQMNSGIERTVSNGYGTNYELALNMVQQQVNSIRQNPDRQECPIYVIFISDGLPTAYINNLNDEVTAYDNMINIPEGLTRDKIDGQENIENLNWVLGTSIDAVSSFKTSVDAEKQNIQICTIGLGTDMGTVMNNIGHSVPATDAEFYYSSYYYDFLLQDLASVDPANTSLKLYRQVTNKNSLQSALGYFIRTPSITKILISDELSEYVSLYANQLDLKVSKTTLTGTKTDLTISYDASAKNYKVTDNGSEIGRILIDDKTISMDFRDDLDYSTGNTYTISFNVEATTQAYEEYAENNGGYNGVIGDIDTDYISLNADGTVAYSNATSSGKAGFHSNETARVEYTYNGTETTGIYKNPVIQVGESKLEIQKVWEPDEPNDVTEIAVKVYKDSTLLTTLTLKKTDDWKAVIEHIVPKKLLATENDSAVRDKNGVLIKKTQYIPYVYTLEEEMRSDNTSIAEILDDYEPTYVFTATESGDEASFTNITSRYENGKLIYYIPENGESPASDIGKAEIKNCHKQDIVIIKINENTRNDQTPTKLSGAYFRLMKYNGSIYVAYDGNYGAEEGVPVGDAGDLFGVLTYENLASGEYKIIETRSPAGYIKTADNDIFIRIERGGVTRYDKPAGDSTRREIPASLIGDSDTHGSNVVYGISYVVDADDSEATFTIGNAPGVELPSTGGSGTNCIYLFGIILMVAAAIGLGLKKQQKNIL